MATGSHIPDESLLTTPETTPKKVPLLLSEPLQELDAFDIEGFVQDVSPIRQGPASTWFDFKFQHQEGFIRAVSFKPDIREEYVMAAEEQSPCALASYSRSKRSFSDIPEFIIKASPKKMKRCPFPYAPISREQLTVSDLHDIPNGAVINVIGKLCCLGQVRTKKSKNQDEDYSLQEGYLCDKKDSVSVTLWQAQITQVVDGASYLFKNFRVDRTASDIFL